MAGAHLLGKIIQIILRDRCCRDLISGCVICGQFRNILFLLQQMLLIIFGYFLHFVIRIVFKCSEVQGIAIILGLHILPLHIDPRHGQRCQNKGRRGQHYNTLFMNTAFFISSHIRILPVP